MSKLIETPSECGYYGRGNHPRVYCGHPKRKGGTICNTPYGFPNECPLQDGVTINDAYKQVAENAQEVAVSTVKRINKIKRRNRRNCVHYNRGNCRNIKLITIKCQGVNCGHYTKM